MAKIEMPSSSINSTGETPKKQLKKSRILSMSAITTTGRTMKF